MSPHFKISSLGLVLVLLSHFALAAPPRNAPAPAPTANPRDKKAPTGGKAGLVGVIKLSDEAPHSAFTDLTFFKNRWYCVFREGAAHVSPDGAIAILTSTDAEKWERAATLKRGDGDLRDPKINVTPGGRLMLSAAIAIPKANGAKEHRTYVWFSEDGKKWGEPTQVGDVNVWIWRIVWEGRKAYGVGYGTLKPLTRLYESEEGTDFTTVVKSLFEGGQPSEAGLTFQNDKTAVCLLRRDQKGDDTAQFGTARPPYTQWIWQDLGVKIGGPDLITLPDGRLLAAARFYEPQAHTALAWLDPTLGTLTPFLDLPSSGDCSYPGLVYRDGLLRVSYYSSHEGKTAVYLATVKLP